MSKLFSAAALLLFAATSGVHAAAMPVQGEVCASCHGADGKGQPNVAPMLAGLDSQYLQTQIALFISGERQNPMMTAMAQGLSDSAVRKSVLDYYSALPTYQFTHLEQRGDQADISNPYRKLIYQGDWDRNIPACSTCHGASGMGVATFPRLASQHADYLKNQLHSWKNGTRQGDPLNMMATIAGKLTDDEIENLAFYFASFRY
ncbi:c-type cytochrome [Vibrio fluvialis]